MATGAIIEKHECRSPLSVQLSHAPHDDAVLVLAEDNPYAKLGPADIDTAAGRALAKEAAAQSLVLLRNRGGCLPLRGARAGHIALIGPD